MHADNVDYDAVKHLIKECTGGGKGKAIDIPGQGDDAVILGEKRLYGALVSEHERVELFVKSKSNEIQGRLGRADHTSLLYVARLLNMTYSQPRTIAQAAQGAQRRRSEPRWPETVSDPALCQAGAGSPDDGRTNTLVVPLHRCPEDRFPETAQEAQEVVRIVEAR